MKRFGMLLTAAIFLWTVALYAQDSNSQTTTTTTNATADRDAAQRDQHKAQLPRGDS